jgi:hypothetical protein
VLSLDDHGLGEKRLREAHRPEGDLAFWPIEGNAPGVVRTVQMNLLISDALSSDAIDGDRMEGALKAGASPLDRDTRIRDPLKDQPRRCDTEGELVSGRAEPFDDEIDVED